MKILYSAFFPFRINAVSNGQVRGDSYSEGCMGQTGVCLMWWRQIVYFHLAIYLFNVSDLLSTVLVACICACSKTQCGKRSSTPCHSVSRPFLSFTCRCSSVALYRLHAGFWLPHRLHVDSLWRICSAPWVHFICLALFHLAQVFSCVFNCRNFGLGTWVTVSDHKI